MMRAVLLTGVALSRQDVSKMLTVSEVSRPACGDSQVLVKVKAASLNIEDLMTACHRRPFVSATATEQNPVVLGSEFSGEIVHVGKNVEGFEPKQAVLGLKLPFRERRGTWAEYVSVPASWVVKKPETMSFPQAAALPMSALVARGAVEAAGFYERPLLVSPHKSLSSKDIQVVAAPDNEALLIAEGTKVSDMVQNTKVAVVGASSTIGSLVVDMLASRGIPCVGVSSSESAPSVIANGAVGVLNRHKNGGLGRKGSLTFDVIIDCVGGEKIENEARIALGEKGHFITVVGPGNAFGEGGDGFVNFLHGFKIFSRKIRSLFSPIKYTLATMPMFGFQKSLSELTMQHLKPLIDSEVEMTDEKAVKAAIDKVAAHRNRGRILLCSP